MAYKIKTEPTEEPVDLDSVKQHLRVDTTDDDILIQTYIKAARLHAEAFSNRAYCTKTIEYYLDAFPSEDHIDIPLPPLVSISSIKYYDTANTDYLFPLAPAAASTVYYVDTYSEPGRVVLVYGGQWPSTTLRPANGVLITYVAGYGLAQVVPQNVKMAMLLLIGDYYENREVGNAAQATPFTNQGTLQAFYNLLWPERITPV